MKTNIAENDTAAAPEPVLQTGENCWKIAPVSRASLIVDVADYFKAFAETCLAAKKQILILGWDFDRREPLFREDEPDIAGAYTDMPQELGAFLVSLVKRNPELNIYLLSWDFNMIYAAERELLPALRLRMQAPPRFHFRLDGVHPKGASHHQKLVVMDDRIAFVGGIDLSRWRWDTSEHLADDPRRTDPNGKPYPPFHDMMLLVEGDAARHLGDLARERWHRARGWKIKPPPTIDDSPWPASVEPGVTDAQVAIARTEPAHRGREAVDEVHRLYLDAIAAAERSIYIENQYFTSESVANALAERLREADGPEVVMVLPEKTGGWLEQMTMDVLRSRVAGDLRKADAHGRLRIYYPHQPGLGDDCISVHAKLMIIDDRLLRVGSSNLSNRSMGLDTECDTALEAVSSDEPVARYIHSVRSRLLAEHLGCEPSQVDRALEEEGDLIPAIESLRGEGRSLRELDCGVAAEVDEMVPDAGLIDPTEPFSPDYFVAQYVPKRGRSTGRRRLWLFALVIIAMLGLAAAWRWTPLQDFLTPERIGAYLNGFSSEEQKAAVAVGGFIVASLLMVPVTLLAVVGGIVFDGWQAFAFVLAGAMGAAMIGFLSGRVFGRSAVQRLAGSQLQQISKRIARRGTVAVAVLRLVPIAPFAVFNLIAGSSHLGTRQFLLGSLIGLAPGLGAITLFSNSLWQAITAPSPTNLAVVAAVGVGLAALAWTAKRWLRTS